MSAHLWVEAHHQMLPGIGGLRRDTAVTTCERCGFTYGVMAGPRGPLVNPPARIPDCDEHLLRTILES